MEKAYFNNIRSEIIPLLNGAKSNINIAMAWFTNHDLFESIINALGRGVDVRLVLLDNANNWMPYAPDFNDFIEAGGELFVADSSIGFMHHKFCVIDDDLIVTGSYNWTYFAETRNIENILVSDNISIIKNYQQEFDSLVEKIGGSTTNACRMSWDEVEAANDVDFVQLNYDIENVAKIKHQEVRTFIIPKIESTVERTNKENTPKNAENRTANKPIVSILDTRKKVISKYSIGIPNEDEPENPQFDPLVVEGTVLPASTKEEFYPASGEKIYLRIFKSIHDKTHSEIKEVDISEITKGSSNKNVKIEIDFSLSENGYLNVAILCEETNKRMNIQHVDTDFIAYENE